jgi:hypothetical protein
LLLRFDDEERSLGSVEADPQVDEPGRQQPFGTTRPQTINGRGLHVQRSLQLCALGAGLGASARCHGGQHAVARLDEGRVGGVGAIAGPVQLRLQTRRALGELAVLPRIRALRRGVVAVE